MTDTNTSPSADVQLTSKVTATGNASQTMHGSDPELQPQVDAILKINPMDVPRPYDIPDGWASNLTLRATALAPEQQREVAAKLEALGELSPEQKAAKEAEFTADVIKSQRSRLIVQGGVGSDATPYHREQAGIARDVDDLNRRYDALQSDLERIVRHNTERDPITGELKAVPVYAVTGTRAKAYVEEQQDIARRVRLLVKDDGTYGIEGAKRVQQALATSAVALKALQRQVHVNTEAKRRAAEISLEKEINERAESLARLNRNGG